MIGDTRVYRKGCTGTQSIFNFARRFERRPSWFAKRDARAFDESLTLRGVLNVDSHGLPKGLHGRSSTFRLSKGRLRRNPTFQEDLGKPFSQKWSQKYMFRARLSFKSQKTLRESDVLHIFADGRMKYGRFGIHLRIPIIPIIPRIRCQEPRLGASLPHAPGARMT